MANTAGLVAGIVLTCAGVLGAGFSVMGVLDEWGLLVPLGYSLVALGLGVYLIVNNKREDAIEQIKKEKQ
jgi:hypothetical protein